jgi:hypothetical protein
MIRPIDNHQFSVYNIITNGNQEQQTGEIRMTIQPNSTLQYKDGSRRVTVSFQNMIQDGSEDDGLIGFSVSWRQASKSGFSGSARVHPETHQVTIIRDGGMQEYINKAVSANS